MENSNDKTIFQTRIKPQFSIEQILRKDNTKCQLELWKSSGNTTEMRKPVEHKPKCFSEPSQCGICERENYLRYKTLRRYSEEERLAIPIPIEYAKTCPCNTQATQNILRNQIYRSKVNCDSCDACEHCMPPLIHQSSSLPSLIRQSSPLPPLRRHEMSRSAYNLHHFEHTSNMFPFDIFDNTQTDRYNNQRNVQVRFTSNQSKKLEQEFELHKYISNEQRKEIAEEINLSERQVKTWFQNRRAKWRRIKLEGKLSNGCPSRDTIPLLQFLHK